MKAIFDSSPAEEAEDWGNVDYEAARATLEIFLIGNDDDEFANDGEK